MNILLIQVDGKLPNLALMKISAYHKSIGNKIGLHVIDGLKTKTFLHIEDPNEVYVSCIFSKNLNKAKSLRTVYKNAQFHLGGPGLWFPNS